MLASAITVRAPAIWGLQKPLVLAFEVGLEDDPIDDAKALLASLTYGRTRSEHTRGKITLPTALLRALIEGREVGGDRHPS